MQGCFTIRNQNVTEHITRMKDENHVIILTDAGRKEKDIQHPFMIKILKKQKKMARRKLPQHSDQFSSVTQSCPTLATPWIAARQASLSNTNSQRLLKLMSIELVLPSNNLILCHPHSSFLQSFLASGPFLVSQFFISGGQNIRVSASVSVLPMNIQD